VNGERKRAKERGEKNERKVYPLFASIFFKNPLNLSIEPSVNRSVSISQTIISSSSSFQEKDGENVVSHRSSLLSSSLSPLFSPSPSLSTAQRQPHFNEISVELEKPKDILPPEAIVF
jgi:hypothetical protein